MLLHKSQLLGGSPVNHFLHWGGDSAWRLGGPGMRSETARTSTSDAMASAEEKRANKADWPMASEQTAEAQLHNAEFERRLQEQQTPSFQRSFERQREERARNVVEERAKTLYAGERRVLPHTVEGLRPAPSRIGPGPLGRFLREQDAEVRRAAEGPSSEKHREGILDVQDPFAVQCMQGASAAEDQLSKDLFALVQYTQKAILYVVEAGRGIEKLLPLACAVPGTVVVDTPTEV